MAYTNAWDETKPLGTAAADTLESIIQQLKLDLHERLNTLVVDWTTDPVVPIDRKRTGLKLLIAGAATLPLQDDDDISRPDGYFQSDNSTQNGAQLPLPVRSDWKITKVEVLFDLSTDTSVTIGLQETTLDASATTTQLGTVVVSAAGIGLKTPFTGNATVGDNYFWLKFTGSDAGRYKVYAVRITYDEV